MIKILFVCWGNICRSPMAEFVMKDLVAKRGLEEMFYIESAAHSTEEIGNPVYPPARAELARHGISCDGKKARQMRRDDYDKFDYIIGMEKLNLGYMNRILEADPEGKVHLLMDFTDHPEDIDDPWYTGDFRGVYNQILEGCETLIEKSLKKDE
ncbi:MAG: low molecular weight phosphotyrosine protein phosphatase [Lachnospiraceae bacterium]|nr:low molecular weight phosphotyrosine protein phosphatase [Lachnospiraceae bacterium]